MDIFSPKINFLIRKLSRFQIKSLFVKNHAKFQVYVVRGTGERVTIKRKGAEIEVAERIEDVGGNVTQVVREIPQVVPTVEVSVNGGVVRAPQVVFQVQSKRWGGNPFKSYSFDVFVPKSF